MRETAASWYQSTESTCGCISTRFLSSFAVIVPSPSSSAVLQTSSAWAAHRSACEERASKRASERASEREIERERERERERGREEERKRESVCE